MRKGKVYAPRPILPTAPVAATVPAPVTAPVVSDEIDVIDLGLYYQTDWELYICPSKNVAL